MWVFFPKLVYQKAAIFATGAVLNLKRQDWHLNLTRQFTTKALWNKNNLNYEVKKKIRIIQNEISLKNQPYDDNSKKNNESATLKIAELIKQKDSLLNIKNEIAQLKNENIELILLRAQEFGVPLNPPNAVPSKEKKTVSQWVPRSPFHKYIR